MSSPGLGRRGLCAAATALFVQAALVRAAAGSTPSSVASGDKPRVALKTALGVIVVELESQKAPITSANFLRYAKAGRHAGANFFRASRVEGAPTTGFIEGRLTNLAAQMFPPIRHESTLQTGLSHQDGTISMARGALGTARVDFFICCGPTPSFDADPKAEGDNAGYAAFGSVVEGMDVVRAILALPTPGKAPNPAMQGQILEPTVAISGVKTLA